MQHDLPLIHELYESVTVLLYDHYALVPPLSSHILTVHHLHPLRSAESEPTERLGPRSQNL